RPGVFERLVLLAGFEKGHQIDSEIGDFDILSLSPCGRGQGVRGAGREAGAQLCCAPLIRPFGPPSPTRGEVVSRNAASIAWNTPSRFSLMSRFQKRSTR